MPTWKNFELKNDEGRVTWNSQKAKDKEIPIGEKATDVIIDLLKKLDDSKKLTNEHFSLYEKFMKGE